MSYEEEVKNIMDIYGLTKEQAKRVIYLRDEKGYSIEEAIKII